MGRNPVSAELLNLLSFLEKLILGKECSKASSRSDVCCEGEGNRVRFPSQPSDVGCWEGWISNLVDALSLWLSREQWCFALLSLLPLSCCILLVVEFQHLCRIAGYSALAHCSPFVGHGIAEGEGKKNYMCKKYSKLLQNVYVVPGGKILDKLTVI